MTTDVDVLVIGAGVSGLTAAFRLQQRGVTVEVLDAGEVPGGVMQTRRRDGFLYETGPNSTLDTTPLINALFADLGIADERADASAVASTRFIVRNGRLVALPTSPGAFLSTHAFSVGAKLRLLREPFVRPLPPSVDESIADFVRRRLGAEFLDYAIDPFVAGIYAGDPERISVPAAFPRLAALEQKYGSLIKGQIRGARERRKNPEQAKNVARTFSFKAGMHTLPAALARALRRVESGVRAQRLAREVHGTYVVEAVRGGESIVRRARAVVLAVPAHPAAGIVANLAPQAAGALMAIDYAPVAIVASAYRRADVTHSLAGFGFLVPRREKRGMLGTLFSSSMFPGRAPEGAVLLTTFVGGRRNPEKVALSDTDLAREVGTELAALVGASPTAQWHQTVRWPQAIPQYDLGHLDRLLKLAETETALPGLRFCANYRGGVSVGDCIKSAHAAADAVHAYLSGA